MLKSLSLRAVLAASSAILIISLTGILSYFIGIESSRQVKTEIGSSLSDTAIQMSDKLDTYMWARSGEIDLLSKLDSLRSKKDINEIQRLLDKLKENFPAFSWVGFTDANGIVLASTDKILKGVDISKRPVFTEALKGPFVGDVHEAVLLANLLPNPTGEPMKFVDISTPIFDSNSKLTGVLAAHLSWEWTREIKETLMKPIKNDKDVELFIISSKDDVVLLGPKAMMGHPLNLESIKTSRSKDSSWMVETWPDNKTYLTGYAFGKGYGNYKGLGWSVLVRQPVDLAYAPVKKLQNSIIIIGVGFALIFAVISWFWASFIVRPLNRIAVAANKLRLGEKADIPKFKGISDIEMLSYSLRKLINSLTNAENKLDKLEIEAHHDALTGLANRSALENFLKYHIIEADRVENSFVFLYLDLDGFKGINDSLGHHAGDLVLKEVAIRLEKSINSSDMAVRLGGDEFIAVLRTSTESAHETAQLTAKNILSLVIQPMQIDGANVTVGCSIGAAVWPKDNSNPKKVIELADEALYLVKRNGKNNIAFHTKK